MTYPISIQQKDLCKVVDMDLAGLFQTWVRLCGSDIAAFKKQGKLDRNHTSSLKGTENLLQYITVAAEVLGTIDKQWRKVLFDYAETCKLPKDFCPPGCKPLNAPEKQQDKKSRPQKTRFSKKKGKLPILSLREQNEVRTLRTVYNLPIKVIAKQVHRAEKVVANFVHLVDREVDPIKAHRCIG